MYSLKIDSANIQEGIIFDNENSWAFKIDSEELNNFYIEQIILSHEGYSMRFDIEYPQDLDDYYDDILILLLSIFNFEEGKAPFVVPQQRLKANKLTNINTSFSNRGVMKFYFQKLTFFAQKQRIIKEFSYGNVAGLFFEEVGNAYFRQNLDDLFEFDLNKIFWGQSSSAIDLIPLILTKLGYEDSIEKFNSFMTSYIVPNMSFGMFFNEGFLLEKLCEQYKLLIIWENNIGYIFDISTII